MKVWKWLGAAAALYGLCWLAARRQRRLSERAAPPIGEFVTVDGVPLHYVRSGEGQAVLLLHGSDGFLQDFSDTILDRVAEQFDAIAIDRPGHGYSALPAGQEATAAVQARMIHAALIRLGIDRPLIVAHSWSALLALFYAWRYPRDVAGLVLLAPWLYPGRTGEPILKVVCRGWVSQLIYPLFAPFRRLVVRHFLAQAFAPEAIPEPYGRLAETLWLRSARHLQATARENSGIRRALGPFSETHVPEEIPVHILTGALDRVTPPGLQAQRLLQSLPHSRLTLIPSAGHELAHAAPDTVLEAIHRVAALAATRTGDAPAGQEALTEFERARSLVMRFGWNATAFQILNPEMERWFTRDGEGCVGYVTWGGVRVVAGSPICAADRLVEVAAEFEREARRLGERVCYFGAAERLRQALTWLPHHTLLPIGAQPVWNPRNWGEMLARNRSLRAQLNRARNKGVSVSEWSVERATDPRLVRCFDEWRASHGSLSLHFLTEPVDLARLRDRRLFVAERADVPVGFLIAAPVPERNGWLVEQVARGSAAPNGAAELLIDGLVRALAEEGCAYITLGLAPLSRRGGIPPTRHLWLRLLLAWIRAHGTRFYNFEGLDAFKGKFQPDCWEPIFAISNEPRFSVHTLYGIAAAFTEGAPLAAISGALLAAVRQEWQWLLQHRAAAPKSADTGQASAGSGSAMSEKPGQESAGAAPSRPSRQGSD